jgi:hypothetical protein
VILKLSLFDSLILAVLMLFPQAFAASTPPKLPAPQLPINTPGFNFKAAANFDDLRHNILELIAAGKKRVWLLTDSLADGEIASALYTAKARNQDVKVYLGRDLLNAPGSRLPYLRGSSIPTYLRPRSGYTAPTFLFVDQRLYALLRDLNPAPNARGGEIVQASPADVKAFVAWLKEVMENPEIAYPRAFRSGRTPKEPFQGDSEGSYNYDRKSIRGKAPEGVTRELPRIPKWKQIEDMRRQGIQSPSEALPLPSSPAAPPANDDVNMKPEPSTAPEVEGPRLPEANPFDEPGKPVRSWIPPPAPSALPPQPSEAGNPTTMSP